MSLKPNWFWNTTLVKCLEVWPIFFEWCNVPPHPTKKEARQIFDKNPDVWGRRPLQPKLLVYAAYDVVCLFSANKFWRPKLQEENEGIK